ncbi:MAG: glycosyltransferase family 1 protein [bacterium]
MNKRIVIFDPTVNDQMSKVRGIGRYFKLLKEALKGEAIFTNSLEDASKDSIFINPFFGFFNPPLFKKRNFVKQIAVIHDLVPIKYKSHFPVGIKGYFNYLKNKKTLVNYDLIITDSESSKNDLIKILNIDEQKIKVVYPSLTNNFLKTNLKTPSFVNEKSIFMLYVGDATWNKNLANLAKAVKKIGISAVFVGKVFNESSSLNHPWQKDLKSFFALISDDKNFVFPGFISDNELLWLYKNAICNVLVSRDEGFGFSYLEASSQKTPSVLSDIPVFKEIAQDNAIFVNNQNPTDIADKINGFFKNKALRDTIGEEAYERSRFFSQSAFKKNFLSALNS